MQNQEQPKVYQVLIFRKDTSQPMTILESEKFKDCKLKWQELHEQWQTCHKEAKPFILEKPIVTAFEPGLISEIVVVPKNEFLVEIDSDNPYKKEMLQNGLSSTFKGVGGDYKQTVNSSTFADLLDNGYR